jgi:ankyrin repeat protein
MKKQMLITTLGLLIFAFFKMNASAEVAEMVLYDPLEPSGSTERDEGLSPDLMVQQNLVDACKRVLDVELLQQVDSPQAHMHPKIIKDLLEKGANPNAVDVYGETSLHRLVRSEGQMRGEYFYGAPNPEIARILLAAGAQIDFRSPLQGAATPLELAINMSKDVAALLLSKGAQLSEPYRMLKGTTFVLHCMLKSEYPDFCMKPDLTVKNILDSEENQKQMKLNNLFYYAALAGSYEQCQFLLHRGASVQPEYCRVCSMSHCPLVAAVIGSGTMGTQLLELLMNKTPSLSSHERAYKCAEERGYYFMQPTLMRLGMFCALAIKRNLGRIPVPLDRMRALKRKAKLEGGLLTGEA